MISKKEKKECVRCHRLKSLYCFEFDVVYSKMCKVCERKEKELKLVKEALRDMDIDSLICESRESQKPKSETELLKDEIQQIKDEIKALKEEFQNFKESLAISETSKTSDLSYLYRLGIF